MFSMPPATTISASPSRIIPAPSTEAVRPLAHTLFTVIAEAVTGIPAFIAACRAGACPTPAWSTLPIRV